MQFLVPSDHVRMFARTLMCLSRVGEHAVIEATPSAVILRTLSQSQSAYAHATLSKDFFTGFSCDGALKCKVLLKPCVSVFRALGNVDVFEMRLERDECKLVFVLTAKSGMRREFRFDFEEQDQVLQADFSRAGKSVIEVSPGVFNSSVVANFHPTLEEVTFVPRPHALVVRSYFDVSEGGAAAGEGHAMHTNLVVRDTETSRFEVDGRSFNAEITFCLGELRAMLSFCDAVDAPLFFFFERGGSPMVMSNSAEGSDLCSLEVVLATLQDNSPDGGDGGDDNNDNSSNGGGEGARGGGEGTHGEKRAREASARGSAGFSFDPDPLSSSSVRPGGTGAPQSSIQQFPDTSPAAVPSSIRSRTSGVDSQMTVDTAGTGYGNDGDDEDEDDERVAGTPQTPSDEQQAKRQRHEYT